MDKAYEQTGNYDDMLKKDEKGEKRRSYRPAGQITVYYTRLEEYIGLEGVEVRARRWFITHKGYPNYEGNYSVDGTFKRPCNYSLWMHTDLFRVCNDGIFNNTYHINGPKIQGDWNRHIAGGYARFEAHIFRGAYMYYFKDIDDLKRPGVGFFTQMNRP